MNSKSLKLSSLFVIVILALVSTGYFVYGPNGIEGQKRRVEIYKELKEREQALKNAIIKTQLDIQSLESSKFAIEKEARSLGYKKTANHILIISDYDKVKAAAAILNDHAKSGSNEDDKSFSMGFYYFGIGLIIVLGLMTFTVLLTIYKKNEKAKNDHSEDQHE